MGARGLPIFERDRVVARGKGCSRGLMHSSSGRIYDFREDEEITMFIAMVGCGIMVGNGASVVTWMDIKLRKI